MRDARMDTDDLAPQRPPEATPKDLESMSIEALGAHIEELEKKIARARRAIEAKRRSREGAEAAFRS